MRLAIVLAPLLFASSAIASEDVPPQARYGIEALVAARYTLERCPTYRVDEMALVGIMMSTELTADDVSGRYGAVMRDVGEKARSHEGMSDQDFCDALFHFYQAEKTERHLIERR